MAKKYYDTNKNARIVSRRARGGSLRTETMGRDSGVDVAVVTDVRSEATRLFIDLEGRSDGSFNGQAPSLELTGREARTLFRVLASHFNYTDKSLKFG